MSTSPYQTGLGPKILSRARLIFGSLLVISIIFIVAGMYQGIVSGSIYKTLVLPFKEFSTDFKEALETKPIPSLTPVLTPVPTTISNSTSTSKSTVIINQTVPAVQQKQPVVANCIRKNIREGEFASNKCYSEQDFEDLEYYLGRYNDAIFDRDAAVSFMNITCGGKSEMFQQDCEKQKTRKTEAEASMDKYRSIVQGIIAKGR